MVPQKAYLYNIVTTNSSYDEQIKVYPFDKGIAFALLNDMDDISKIEEQLGKSKIIDYDPTNLLTGKFQRLLRKLKKEEKFDKKTYSLIYPSYCIPPRLYGTLKAHKPEKNHPMRAVVSTIGSPPYGTSKYLVKIIQPTLNKNKYRVLNSYSFVEEAKEWNISPNEIQTSFDVVNLYPSFPIDEAVAVIIEILNNDIDDLRKRTKLTLTDIQKLIELCLSSNYFIFDNRVRVLKNSGPIGLALMVVISEVFLQRLEDKAIQEALATNLAPLTYKRYVDDSHARFETVHQSHSFLNILNKQNRAIQYTMGKKDQSQKLNFLDVTITNTGAGKYEFKIHRKNAITNVQIKPHSFVNSSLIRGIFKGFVSRSKRLCSGKYLDEELNFLVDMFVENGHDRNYLNSIISENKHQAPNTENKDSNIVRLPWIRIIGPKIRK